MRPSRYVHFCAFPKEQIPGLRVMFSAAANAGKIVVEKQHLVRQALTHLKFGKSTSDPNVAAGLFENAADLRSQMDQWTMPADLNPRSPDV